MNPVQDLAWLCGRCRKPYQHEDHAKQCCTCNVCGGTSEHLGRLSRCRICGVKEMMEHNLKYRRDLELQLERTRLEAKSRGILLIEHPDDTVEVKYMESPAEHQQKNKARKPTKR